MTAEEGDVQRYLRAVHAALINAGFRSAGAEVADTAPLVEAYRRYILALESLDPPQKLEQAHRQLTRACQEMAHHLAGAARIDRLRASAAELEPIARRGADAIARLQSESDRMGLGLRFQ
jgi:hypothetical protein